MIRGGVPPRTTYVRASFAIDTFRVVASRATATVRKNGHVAAADANTPLSRCTVGRSWNERARQSTGLRAGQGLHRGDRRTIRAGAGRAASRGADFPSSVREEGAGAIAARAVADLRGRTVLDQAALVEDPDPAGGDPGEGHLVRDHQHGHAAAGEVAQDGE